MIKQFVQSVPAVFEALSGATSTMLKGIRGYCASQHINPIRIMIDSVINEDTTYQSRPLDLRNQRTYAVKTGVNSLLDIARQTYKEAVTDAYHQVTTLGEDHSLSLELKYDPQRQFYIQLSAQELEHRTLPPVFTNVFKKRGNVECQTLDLVKLNQKISDSHNEVLLMSDQAVQDLIAEIRGQMSVMFKICESIAMLDMISSFAHLAAGSDYVRPILSNVDTLAVKSGRHPIAEKVNAGRFVPNDVYATQQTRTQIVTGCNMSGKSTYIRSIALMAVMVQIGCFVPADFASFPIMHQMFARVNADDSIEANVSSFAAEMRETAFILRNIDRRSLAIVDELGRGTSTRDGLAIAIAIAEALVESRALVFFATHFRDLATILSEREGVANFHLAVDMSQPETMKMLYKIASGTVREGHYGLSLARVVTLPPDVLEYGTMVADHLQRQVEQRKRTSAALNTQRRRRLVLNLREHLVQAQKGPLNDEALNRWLKDLQREFVIRMSALNAEAIEADAQVATEDTYFDDKDGQQHAMSEESEASQPGSHRASSEDDDKERTRGSSGF